MTQGKTSLPKIGRVPKGRGPAAKRKRKSVFAGKSGAGRGKPNAGRAGDRSKSSRAQFRATGGAQRGGGAGPGEEAAKGGEAEGGKTLLVLAPSKLTSMLLSQRKAEKRRPEWLHVFREAVLGHLQQSVTRGSKYIYREKMSLKHFGILLKKFRFGEAQIRRIAFLKKKFEKVFEANIKEIFFVNPKTPAGFKNPKGPCLESEAKVLLGGNAALANRAGLRAVLHRDQHEQEMRKVAG